MENPLISIIIPTYNSSTTINRCLDSLVIQSFKEFEVIVVDGLSKDETKTLVIGYQEKLTLQWNSEKDNGIYDAVNKGILKSKGKWVYVLGSDDYLFAAETLKLIATEISKNQTEVIYGNVKVVGDAGWAKNNDLYDGPFSLEKLIEKNICQQAVFYKRTLFDEIGLFNPKYKVCSDWDFMLRCFARKKCKFVDITVAGFNGGGASQILRDIDFSNELLLNLHNYFGSRLGNREFGKYIWEIKKLATEQRNRLKFISAVKFYFIYRRHLKIKEQNA